MSGVNTNNIKNIRVYFALVRRNVLMFFKDKGLFFTALITPAILLVLYSSFLGNIYRDSILQSMPSGLSVPEKLINGLVGSQLLSSILAVSAVTVAFCSNMLMVRDKATGTVTDFRISPVKSQTLSLAYYTATLISTFAVCLFGALVGFIYLAFVGWYMSFSDVLLLLLAVFLLTMFGTALSSIVNFFLSTQGQISAVGTLVSSGYGFICGAYMPIASFSSGLQKVLMFTPGIYATSLLKSNATRGAFRALSDIGAPDALIDGIKSSINCTLTFFEKKVETGAMYLVLCLSTAVLIAVYILQSAVKRKR